MRRLKVLLSAYACEPDKGSEPGVGWNAARELTRHHDVWVLTCLCHRAAIEAELARSPIQGLHVVYYDLPHYMGFLKRWHTGVNVYYYLWQLGAYSVARKLHEEWDFDVAQHVTYVRYWMPSFLAFLSVPFVWGPVGGGESAPKAFWRTFGLRGMAYEAVRDIARWLGERDPLVRRTTRRAMLALATTEETARRIRRLGARRVELMGVSALGDEDLERLTSLPDPPTSPFRLLSIGRLLHLKGLHLSLEAFARARLEGAEYWIVGNGPERVRLERLARRLGVADRVAFWGWLPRAVVLSKIAECHVLAHPSLHDSGGWVCVEAMAAGRPVICLDLGGPAVQVSAETGIKVAAHSYGQATRDLACAMQKLAGDRLLLAQMGQAAKDRAQIHFSWASKCADLARRLQDVAAEGG